jgi:sugar phosphate isomerase/epimerase
MIKRRNFLQQAGLISAGLIIAPSCVLSETTKSKKKLGLQLYTLREVIGKDLKGVISKVAAAGYQEVETYGFSKENGFWGLKPKEFKQLLGDNGLTAPSGHYGFDDYLQGKEDILDAYIEAATGLGQEYITVPYLGEPLRRSADDYKKIAAKLNVAAEKIKKANLQLAYHNHDFEFVSHNGTSGYDIFIKETDPSLLKFEIDLYWAARAKQDINALFSQNKGRFVMWHVKDMDKTKPELNTEVGSGSINYKEIFALAKTAGVKHYFVEQENFTSIDPFVSIGKSADYVTKNLLS